MRLLATIFVSGAIAVTGCQSLPSIKTPPPPPRWKHAPASPASLQLAAPQAWWTAFPDTALHALIRSGLERNTDVAAAALRLRNAQLRVGAATQALLPTPSASANAGASRGATPAPGAPAWQRNYGASAGLGWEIDLWGRLRDARAVAAFERDATEADRLGVSLTLSHTIARQYWQLAALRARVGHAETSLAVAERTLKLTDAQYRAGAISGLDRTQAVQAVTQQRNALTQIRQQEEEARLAFSLLFDLPPGELPRGQSWPDAQVLQQAGFADIPAGTPADVLLARPDLIASGERLQASALNVRITRKQFLPGVSFSAGLNTGGSSLSDILSNPSKSLGMGLSLPFLNVGEAIRQPRIAANDHAIAVLQYRATVLRALQEVESALSSLQAQRTQLALQEDVVRSARRIERMYEVRYRAGAVPLRQWLDAQESLRQTELALVDARAGLLQAAATLRVVLGGGVD